jgi:hypothetical protein
MIKRIVCEFGDLEDWTRFYLSLKSSDVLYSYIKIPTIDITRIITDGSGRMEQWVVNAYMTVEGYEELNGYKYIKATTEVIVEGDDVRGVKN